ncbi:hypothetical protein COSO111634_30220 [Corallococcus soli]
MHASPTDATTSSRGSADGSRGASDVGVTVRVVMRSETSTCCNGGPGNRDSGGANTSVAPDRRVENSSHTEASKPMDASCRSRRPGRSARAERRAMAVLHRPWCGSSAPLGVPVEPEVKMA